MAGFQAPRDQFSQLPRKTLPVVGEGCAVSGVSVSGPTSLWFQAPQTCDFTLLLCLVTGGLFPSSTYIRGVASHYGTLGTGFLPLGTKTASELCDTSSVWALGLLLAHLAWPPSVHLP